MKHVFIIKPTDMAASMETDIAAIMAGCDYITRYVCYAGHAKKIAADYKDEKDRIYVIGGDGLLHEVVQALVGSENEIVVIPAGTGNDFARMVSKGKTPFEVLEKSLELEATKIDVIKCNDIYCVNSCCFGFDADIAMHVHDTKPIKFLPKSLSYTTTLAKRITKLRSFQTRMFHNGENVYDGKLLIGSFNNGIYYGGGFKISPFSLLFDGLMDVNLVPELKAIEIPLALTLLKAGHVDKVKQYYHRQLRTIDLESECEVNIDGEVYPQGRYHIEVIPQALNIVIVE